MDKKKGSILYFILGLYTLMISWFYNHSILLLIVHYIFWPLYLLYALLSGNLADDMWRKIPESYFK
jgi:hypothetical protein